MSVSPRWTPLIARLNPNPDTNPNLNPDSSPKSKPNPDHEAAEAAIELAHRLEGHSPQERVKELTLLPLSKRASILNGMTGPHCAETLSAMTPEERQTVLNAMTDKWSDLAAHAREIFVYIAGQDGDSAHMTKEELVTAHGGDYRLFERLDSNGDGVVTQQEWLAFLDLTRAEKGEDVGFKWLMRLMYTFSLNIGAGLDDVLKKQMAEAAERRADAKNQAKAAQEAAGAKVAATAAEAEAAAAAGLAETNRLLAERKAESDAQTAQAAAKQAAVAAREAELAARDAAEHEERRQRKDGLREKLRGAGRYAADAARANQQAAEP